MYTERDCTAEKGRIRANTVICRVEVGKENIIMPDETYDETATTGRQTWTD